ncbi:MAG: hypothetical protein LQ344_007124 [Seirophora lacunosa]|nr:MAG: hypothetical protein LQ344_007124 [Seirophora lacunosa]
MSSPEEYLTTRHTDAADGNISPTAKHLREEDLTDADAPGETEEISPRQSRQRRASKRKPPRRSIRRPRQARAASPGPKSPSPMPQLSRRRRPTGAERQAAANYVTRLEEELDTIWLNRTHKKEWQNKIRKYRQIAAGGYIEASAVSRASVQSQSSARERRAARETNPGAEGRASSSASNGNSTAEQMFLKRKREEYIRDHPQYFKQARREPDPAVHEKHSAAAAADTRPPRTQRHRNLHKEEKEEQESGFDDYEAVERYTRQKMAGQRNPRTSEYVFPQSSLPFSP